MSSGGGGGGDKWVFYGLFDEGTNSITGSTSSWPNHLQGLSLLISSRWGLWFQHTNLRGNTRIWFMADLMMAIHMLLLLLSCFSRVRLCDPIDGSPPGSPVPGILQARTLECVAISFSSAWKWKVTVKSFSCVRLLATSWTAAYHALPSMGFSRQEYWSGLPLPSPGHPYRNANAHLTQKDSHRHTQNTVWSNVWGSHGLVKLRYKISHHIV